MATICEEGAGVRATVYLLLQPTECLVREFHSLASVDEDVRCFYLVSTVVQKWNERPVWG
jgi:hypothetical protein